jgi:Protein of unknown function (DUF3593)/Protein of unknown function (DUF2499)
MHALSIPTWIIHISSVIEWIAAIWLIWRTGETSGNQSWYGLSFAMLPALVSAMCACTGDPASSHDPPGKLYPVRGRLVDLEICWGCQCYGIGNRIKSSSWKKTGKMISKESLFALSLFPYLGFLWFMTRSKATPRLALVGFYMTLVFVAVTIPAGIYAKIVYNESLANVDWLHGTAEFFLTLANILVVLGFRQQLAQKISS